MHERLDKHDERFDRIEAELRRTFARTQKHPNGQLYDLSEKVENILGYRKEIDHALERVGAIEKHLGLERKIFCLNPQAASAWSTMRARTSPY